MNTNEIRRAPSVQVMQFRAPADVTNRQGGGLAGTARRQAAQLFETSATENIISKYEAIEAEQGCGTGARPQTRRALGDFLIDNRIANPGGLTERQENICLWVALETVAVSQSRTMSLSQLNTFINSEEQLASAKNIVSMLGLKEQHFTP